MICNVPISVIVSTYRRSIELNKALQSLLQQTYKDIEIIVVDDNADNEWSQKVKAIVDGLSDGRIKLVRNDVNLGSAKSRNAGIELASGEYITFLDDDDEYLPEKIDRQLNFMRMEQADYCITDLALYYENGSLSEQRKRSYIEKIDADSLLKYHLKYHMTGTDTLMFKKDFLVRIGMFPPIDVGDEYYLMMNAIKSSGKFVYLNCCDVRAIVHSEKDGLSSGEKKIQGENALYEVKKEYFPQLERKDVRYIKVRHHMVIAFAQMRRKYWMSVCKHGIIAAFISPIDVIRILGQRA